MKLFLQCILFNLAISACLAGSDAAPTTSDDGVYYGTFRMEAFPRFDIWEEPPIETWKRAASIELPESGGENRCGALGPACRCSEDPSWFMHPERGRAVVLASEDGWIVDFSSGTASRLKSPEWMLTYHARRSLDGMGYAKGGERLHFTRDAVCVWETHEMFSEMLKFDMKGELLATDIDWEESPFDGSGDFCQRTGLSCRYFEFLKPMLPIWKLPDNNYMAAAPPSPFIQKETGIWRKEGGTPPLFRLPDIRESEKNGYKVKARDSRGEYGYDVDFVDMQYAALVPGRGEDALHFYFWRACGLDGNYEGGCRMRNESRSYTGFAFLSGTGSVLSQGAYFTMGWHPGLPVDKSKPQRVGRDAVALMVQNSYMDKCGHYLYVIVSPDFAGDKPVQVIRSAAPLYFSPVPLKDGSLVALAPSLWLGKDAPVNRDNFLDLEHDIYGPARIHIIPPPHSAPSQP